MLRVLQQGEADVELQLNVSRGIAVVAETPDDVDAFFALCEFAPRLPASPMQGLFDSLRAPNIDLNAWAAHWRDLHEENPERRDPIWYQANFGQKDSIVGLLLDGLRLMRFLWRAETTENQAKLRLVLAIGDPQVQGPNIELSGEGAALSVQYGSLVAGLLKLPVRLVGFGVLAMLGGGISPAIRSDDMVNRLRGAADYAVPSVPLPRIDQLSPDDLRKGQGLIVLVHGLLSTDVGTFGKLERALVEPSRGSRVYRSRQPPRVVGYPHDSVMKSVDVNARNLLDCLRKVGNPETVLVCHSRGGLVARAAADFNAGNPVTDRMQLRGIITFGTPHKGAGLAESPAQILITQMTLRAWRKTGPGGLADGLSCYLADDKLVGVADLRPARTNDTYLYQLAERERGSQSMQSVELVRVGGTVTVEGIWRMWNRTFFGEQPNDRVVEVSSSAPESRDVRFDQCDHSEYFDHAEAFDPTMTLINRVLG
jgi:pimeloyl-ACP methyl ester carboxylesterase